MYLPSRISHIACGLMTAMAVSTTAFAADTAVGQAVQGEGAAAEIAGASDHGCSHSDKASHMFKAFEAIYKVDDSDGKAFAAAQAGQKRQISCLSVE